MGGTDKLGGVTPGQEIQSPVTKLQLSLAVIITSELNQRDYPLKCKRCRDFTQIKEQQISWVKSVLNWNRLVVVYMIGSA